MTDQSEKLHFEIFVAMNEQGDKAFGHTDREARELLLDEYVTNTIRIVALSVAMTPPRVETGPHVDIPDSAGETVEVETVPLDATAEQLLQDALEDDKREGGTFDAEGFSNFFPEYPAYVIQAAWKLYEAKRFGGKE